MKEIKSVKAFLQAALLLDSTPISTLKGVGKLTDEQVDILIHLSATVSNEIGEMEDILEIFNLSR